MRYIIYNQVISRLKQSDQLLLIIRGKDGVSKSQVIKVINWAYDVVSKINQIFITALTEAIFNNINGSTLHIGLGINTRKTKSLM